MTSHMAHRLPSDDGAFERLMDALDADGLEIRPDERAKFAAAHAFGLLDGILPVVRRAMDTGTTGEQIRHRRRVEEMRRPHTHRATFRAAENHPPAPRWQVSKDGKSFYHPACDRDLPGGIDPADTADKAAHHHHTCPEVRDEY